MDKDKDNCLYFDELQSELMAIQIDIKKILRKIRRELIQDGTDLEKLFQMYLIYV